MRYIKTCVITPLKAKSDDDLHTIAKLIETVIHTDDSYIVTFVNSVKLNKRALNLRLKYNCMIKVKEYKYYYYTGKRFMQWNPLITTINIPPYTTTLPDNAYSYCYGITTINNTENIKSFGKKCFAGTSMLSIKLNPIVSELPYKFCYGCKNLKNINVENITKFGILALAYTDVEYLDIKSMEIPRGLCLGCKHLEHVVFRSPIKIIDHMAFFRCPMLKLKKTDFDLTTRFDKCWKSAID